MPMSISRVMALNDVVVKVEWREPGVGRSDSPAWQFLLSPDPPDLTQSSPTSGSLQKAHAPGKRSCLLWC